MIEDEDMPDVKEVDLTPPDTEEEIPTRTLPKVPVIIPQPFGYEMTPRKFRQTGGTSRSAGAFFSMRTVVSEDSTNGDIYLQGGNVGAGTGNAAISEILLFDQSAGGGSGEWQGAAGDHLVLTVDGTGVEADGVLMPQFNLSAATAAIGGVPGSNTLPLPGSLPGSLQMSLGIFYAGGFAPSAPGDVNVTYCFGGFTPRRI